MNVRERYRQFQINIYQRIADYIVKMAETAPPSKDDFIFGTWFDLGMKFNNYCINKEIYLK